MTAFEEKKDLQHQFANMLEASTVTKKEEEATEDTIHNGAASGALHTLYCACIAVNVTAMPTTTISALL
eukprot:7060689-Ditylum_brightwellii.AAC.1